ncbi:hypothetical protein ABZ402_36775 [Streptomyces mirabilis]|uniref:hypothetical protein n=1 Tax=Streptomyces mirabilis TaxID=68239 RepID=UPI0033E8E2BF
MHVRLPAELDGDIVIYVGTRLVHTLMEHDHVGELRLTVFPVVLWAGERLFGETSDKKPLRLVHVGTFTGLRDARLAGEGATARFGPPIEAGHATSPIRSNRVRGRCRDRQLL